MTISEDILYLLRRRAVVVVLEVLRRADHLSDHLYLYALWDAVEEVRLRRMLFDADWV